MYPIFDGTTSSCLIIYQKILWGGSLECKKVLNIICLNMKFHNCHHAGTHCELRIRNDRSFNRSLEIILGTLPGSIGNQSPSDFRYWSNDCLVMPGWTFTSKSSGWYSKILSNLDKFKQIPPFWADKPPAIDFFLFDWKVLAAWVFFFTGWRCTSRKGPSINYVRGEGIPKCWWLLTQGVGGYL